MSPAYLDGRAAQFGPNPRLCRRHHVYTYGVIGVRGYLDAYLWLYRSNDLALVSSILGHDGHLTDDIMYLLVTGAVNHQRIHGLGGTVVYNLHSSGTDGLRYFKERLGFHPTDIEWRMT